MTASIAATSDAQMRVNLHRAQLDLSPLLRADLASIFAQISSASANDFDSAYKRFVRWRRRDPYTDVPNGLLTGAQVCEYIVETGMLFNCPLTAETVKLASLDFPLLGKIVYWDNGQRKRTDLKKDEIFVLKQDSIAFFTLQPYLMLPDYIAMRFNFRIRNVYKGLLLGTGPLVDPGFQGRLSIPIHNLTNADYSFKGGEGIITAEFTKIPVPKYSVPVTAALFEEADSKGERHLDASLRSRVYVPYPEPDLLGQEAPGRDVMAFLDKSGTDQPIVSSLAPLRTTVKNVRRALIGISVVGGASLLLGFASLAGAIYSAASYADKVTSEVRATIQRDTVMGSQRLRAIDSLRLEQDRLRTELRLLRDSVQVLAKRITR
jgi:deoxycytidine triphosphate deaminase